MKRNIVYAIILLFSLLTGCSNSIIDENEIQEEVVEKIDENEDELFSNRDLENNPDLSDATNIFAESNSEYIIQEAGIYVLSGQATNYTVKVEAKKEEKVQIILQDVNVSNDNFPVIYVKSADKCFVTSLGDNTLCVNNQFIADGDINTDAVIFSKDDLTLNGSGSLNVLSSAGNGITCKDDLKITGGNYSITSALDAMEANDSISIQDGVFTIVSNKDGLHCENDEALGAIIIKNGSFTIEAANDGIQSTESLVIDGGIFNITACEGLEATYIQINDGTININASDDGINAARKSNEGDVLLEINGGYITVIMGPGDTDALDANGTIIMNGGTVDLTCQSSFDADNGCVYNGGTIIINGVETNEIPNSMMQPGPPGMENPRDEQAPFFPF